MLLSSEIATATLFVLTATRASLLSAVSPPIQVYIYAAKTRIDTPLFYPIGFFKYDELHERELLYRGNSKLYQPGSPARITNKLTV